MKINPGCFLRHLFGVLVSVSLAGCIELIPRDVSETITIERDGRVEVEYEGTFNDLRDFVFAVDADNGEKSNFKPDAQNAAYLDKLKADPQIVVVEQRPKGIYRLRWRDEGNLAESKIPQLLSVYGSDRIPRLLQMSGFGELSSSAYYISNTDLSDLKDADGFPPGSRAAKVVGDYFKRFKGKVSIRVDPSMVLAQNAEKAYTESNGMQRFEWSLSATGKNEIELAITLDKRDFTAFKIMNSPQGTSCKELIGQNCKCGPFLISESNGTVLANRGYELNTPMGSKRGCTDKDGNVDAVEIAVTGECTLKLLPPDESEQLCGN